MRKIISLIAACMVCLSLAVPALAAENQFVPSISYKDGPVIVAAEMNEENVKNCLVVTSIIAAKEKTTDIHQEDRDLLLDVYAQLDDGSMDLPLPKNGYVIRELVDVSFENGDCLTPKHGHEEWLSQDKNVITVTFNLGVQADTKVTVLTYVDGEWILAESVENNGDKTVTCVFEDICPVAFCVEEYAEVNSPKTADEAGRWMGLWAIVMIASVAALAAVAQRRRAAR